MKIQTDSSYIVLYILIIILIIISVFIIYNKLFTNVEGFVVNQKECQELNNFKDKERANEFNFFYNSIVNYLNNYNNYVVDLSKNNYENAKQNFLNSAKEIYKINNVLDKYFIDSTDKSGKPFDIKIFKKNYNNKINKNKFNIKEILLVRNDDEKSMTQIYDFYDLFKGNENSIAIKWIQNTFLTNPPTKNYNNSEWIKLLDNKEWKNKHKFLKNIIDNHLKGIKSIYDNIDKIYNEKCIAPTIPVINFVPTTPVKTFAPTIPVIKFVPTKPLINPTPRAINEVVINKIKQIPDDIKKLQKLSYFIVETMDKTKIKIPINIDLKNKISDQDFQMFLFFYIAFFNSDFFPNKIHTIHIFDVNDNKVTINKPEYDYLTYITTNKSIAKPITNKLYNSTLKLEKEFLDLFAKFVKFNDGKKMLGCCISVVGEDVSKTLFLHIPMTNDYLLKEIFNYFTNKLHRKCKDSKKGDELLRIIFFCAGVSIIDVFAIEDTLDKFIMVYTNFENEINIFNNYQKVIIRKYLNCKNISFTLPPR